MAKHFSEIQLLHLVRMGGKDAFRRLYEMYADVLFNYGFHVSHDKELTEDAIQDVFAELWNKRETLPEIKSFKAYLLKSVRYKALAKMKKSLTDRSLMKRFTAFETEETAETQMILEEGAQQAVDQLRHHINMLPYQQREVVFHLFYHNLDYDQTASVMGLSKKTVYNQLHNALEKLRKKVKYLE